MQTKVDADAHRTREVPARKPSVARVSRWGGDGDMGEGIICQIQSSFPHLPPPLTYSLAGATFEALELKTQTETATR